MKKLKSDAPNFTNFIIMEYMEKGISTSTFKSSKYWAQLIQNHKVRLQPGPWFIWPHRLLVLWSTLHHTTLFTETWQHETVWWVQTTWWRYQILAWVGVCMTLTTIAIIIEDALKGKNRKLLVKPDMCPLEVYKIMLECWAHNSEVSNVWRTLSAAHLHSQ